MVDSDLYERVVFGSGDDAVLSELFGLDSPYSEQAEQLRKELIALEVQVVSGRASEQEIAEYQELRRRLGSSSVARADEVAARLRMSSEFDQQRSLPKFQWQPYLDGRGASGETYAEHRDLAGGISSTSQSAWPSADRARIWPGSPQTSRTLCASGPRAAISRFTSFGRAGKSGLAVMNALLVKPHIRLRSSEFGTGDTPAR